MKKPIILLADDDKAICTVLEQAIRRHGYEIIASDNGKSLLELVEQGRGDVVITDIMMPGIGGLELIPKIKVKRPDLPIIVISAVNTLLTAVKVNQLGAYEYLPKPFDLDILLQYVDKALNASGGNSLNFDNSGKNSVDRSPIIGRSPAMQEIYRILARIVSLDLSVMITGESGTGKELIAQALHNLGDRKNKPFIAVNVAAIPKELIESELFGHEKGSFTGAINRKAGAFEQAGSGTLFLDEIGDMPLEAQTRLLRVLQQGEYTSVGGSKTMLTGARIITATHRDLLKLVKKGTFREDLYYRLN
ncbi:MAG: sigma 54-interacting transcriptional regulator, partial [Pseudomonadota bacterium]